MHNTLRLLQPIPLLQLTALLQAIQLVDILQPLMAGRATATSVPSCRSALGWLRSRLLCRRCQMASPYPVRAVQRNLHHRLLRSGVLITGSSRAGMPDARGPPLGHSRRAGGGSKEKLRHARGFLFASRVNRLCRRVGTSKERQYLWHRESFLDRYSGAPSGFCGTWRLPRPANHAGHASPTAEPAAPQPITAPGAGRDRNPSRTR